MDECKPLPVSRGYGVHTQAVHVAAGQGLTLVPFSAQRKHFFVGNAEWLQLRVTKSMG